MIGQEELRKELEACLKSNTFPRFSIFLGNRGSGRKEIILWLKEEMRRQKKLGIFVNRGISVEEVRNAIEECHRLSGVNNVICFPDADTMSPQAKNALLKITEEPPENCYFIMTLEDLQNTLPTIKSRSITFILQTYTTEQLKEFFLTSVNPKATEEEVAIVKEICQTPGEIKILNACGIKDFDEYVQLVVDNISEVSDANSFKIPGKVALKVGDEGYDMKLFFKAFMTECIKRLPEDSLKYSSGISITSNFLQQLDIKGVSRPMLMDAWIIEIRKAWCK